MYEVYYSSQKKICITELNCVGGSRGKNYYFYQTKLAENKVSISLIIERGREGEREESTDIKVTYL